MLLKINEASLKKKDGLMKKDKKILLTDISQEFPSIKLFQLIRILSRKYIRTSSY